MVNAVWSILRMRGCPSRARLLPVRSPGATARQREVLERLAAGEVSKEIAVALGISEAGVKKHLESLRNRYRVTTRAAMIRAAVEHGELLVYAPAQLRSRGLRGHSMQTPNARTAPGSRRSTSQTW